jgi:hypothetical protein
MINEEDIKLELEKSGVMSKTACKKLFQLKEYLK